jgi:hypothetical protein
MTLLHEVIQIGVAALGSSGIVFLAGKFLLSNFVQKRIDFYFSGKLEEIKAKYADNLAILTADLKSKADSRLEEERARYASGLESLKSRLQKDANEELERIKSSYVIQQEIKKSELNVEAQDTLEIFKIRRDKYPPLVELIYRIRNKARDTLQEPNPAASIEGLKGLVTQIEEKVFQLRTYLDSDGVYLNVHSYKNSGQAFAKRLEGYSTLREANKDTEASEALSALQTLYLRLDEEYSQTTAAFKVLIAARQHTKGADSPS